METKGPMSHQLEIRAHIMLDELAVRMRRTAARLAALAGMAARERWDLAATAKLLRGAGPLSKWVPSLQPAVEELAGLIPKEPSPSNEDEAAHVTLALLATPSGGEESLARAERWAGSVPKGTGQVRSLAFHALGELFEATGEERFREAASEGLQPYLSGEAALERTGQPARELAGARALLAFEPREGCLEAARSFHEDLSGAGEPPLGGAMGGQRHDLTDPALEAEWLALTARLWDVERKVTYLDAVERSLWNSLPFGQTDDGGGIIGRSPDGARGEVEDREATPALARGLAEAASCFIFPDGEGGLVAGLFGNAVMLFKSGSRSLRCTVSTQLPVRGWTRWIFEPAHEPTAGVLSSAATTRRTARRRKSPAELAREQEGEAPRAEARLPAARAAETFTFKVRVPRWALEGERAVVKVDGAPKSVTKQKGFIRFEVPVARRSQIEVIFSVKPGLLERTGVGTWSKEVAVIYGGLVLTAAGPLNPGQDLGLPLRLALTSPEELEPVCDIRRRLPVVQAKVLGGGTGRALFSPLCDLGGMAGGIGGTHPVRSDPFRTWHRLGK